MVGFKAKRSQKVRGRAGTRANQGNVICHHDGRTGIAISKEGMMLGEADPSSDERPCGDRKKDKTLPNEFWPPLSLNVLLPRFLIE